MTAPEAFIYGFTGAFLLNVVRLAQLANTPKIARHPTFSDWLWTVQFLGLPVVGGALTWIYQADGANLKPLLAVNIGLSAPLILKAMAVVAPEKPPRNTD